MTEKYSSEEIREFVMGTFEAQKQDSKAIVTLDSSITGDLGIDSLTIMEAVSDLEDKYELTFSDEDLPKVHTVGDVISIVEAELSKDGRLR